MRVLFFASTKTADAWRLVELARMFMTANCIETFDSMEGICVRLRSPKIEPIITVFHLASRRELADLLDMGDLVDDTSLFLVLPDHRPETIAQRLHLRPRYITYRDADVVAGAAVLKKMFDKISQ